MEKVDIKELVSQMTMEEKIGQLVQLSASFFTRSEAEMTGPIQKFGFKKEFLKKVGSVLPCFLFYLFKLIAQRLN